jgi:ABC-type ATPase with predicted acetyltransferase domain
MPIDESNYKTMKLFRCKKCGNVYAANFTRGMECPDCASSDVSHFSPDGAGEPQNGLSDGNA